MSEKLSLKANTWHGTTITIERDMDNVSITSYALPWYLELCLWFLPYIIITYFYIQLKNWKIGQYLIILILLIFFLGTINKRFYPIIYFYMLPFIAIHKFLGFSKTLIFLAENNDNSSSIHSNNTFLIKDVFALGFQGIFSGLDGSLNNDAFFLARINILLKNKHVLSVGGSYGYFFTASSRQKKEFERLYSFLAIVLNLKEKNHPSQINHNSKHHRVSEGRIFSVDGLISSDIYSYNFVKHKDEIESFHFKPIFSEYLNIGFFETYYLAGIALIIISAFLLYLLITLTKIFPLFRLSNNVFDDFLKLFVDATLVRFVYVMVWLFYWQLLKKFKAERYFQFSYDLDNLEAS